MIISSGQRALHLLFLELLLKLLLVFGKYLSAIVTSVSLFLCSLLNRSVLTKRESFVLIRGFIFVVVYFFLHSYQQTIHKVRTVVEGK